MDFDLIRGARSVDGTGMHACRADLAVAGGHSRASAASRPTRGG